MTATNSTATNSTATNSTATNSAATNSAATNSTASTTPAAAAGFHLLGGDLRVARVGFGAMRLPGRSWTGPAGDRDTALAVLARAVELGVNHIDTADFYFCEQLFANDLIREALHPYADDLVIATKVGPARGPDGNWQREASAAELPAQVERNLDQLGLDRLDLVYLRVGGLEFSDESLAERFEVLAGLREQGLIRHLGVSNVNPAQFAEAQRIAPVAAVQNYFNLAHRDHPELVAACAEQGIAYVPFFPLGGHELINDPRVVAVADRHGASVAQIALAWLLDQTPTTLAIPGTAAPDHLAENVAAAGIVLTERDRAELAPLG